ncbi:MAG: tRNA pseudouridine(38-40) synthase TruA [Acetobacteraceae bacterium]
MTRWALLLEYDGTAYVGWQRQRLGVSLQSLLEAAAAHLARGAPVPSVAAGRTDAGVHASGQVALIELAANLTASQVRDALNFHLRPHPLVVLQAAEAPRDWNPRFSAIGRTYNYSILNRRTRPALDRQVWHVNHPLDAAAMEAAAQLLLGRHDFTSFRATACQAKSPIRTLDQLDVSRHGDVILIRAAARSFLHHQVRNMVGTLKLVGEGRWTTSQVAAALAARDRKAAGPTAPPTGLTLTGVRYATDPFTPADADQTPAPASRH